MAFSNYSSLGAIDLARLVLARSVAKISDLLGRLTRGGRELDQFMRHAGLHGCTIERAGPFFLVAGPEPYSGVAHKIRLRRGTSDLAVYFQSMLAGEYLPLVGMIGDDAAKVSSVVDAGANIGATALFLAAQFPNASIHCIEADRSNFDLLQTNIGLNGLGSVQATHGALWDTNEELLMSSILDGRHWTRSVVPAAGQVSDASPVRAITMCEFLEANEIETLDLLKVDIEGAEDRLFPADAEPPVWLARTRYLAIEIHGNQLRGRIEAALRRKEFRVFHSGETTFAENLRLKF
jgi:FkbM family methyltransferase